MIPNREPSRIWMLRRPGTYPNGHVRTASGDLIEVAYYFREDAEPEWFVLSRIEARLLAKRINQCLDETRKR